MRPLRAGLSAITCLILTCSAVTGQGTQRSPTPAKRWLIAPAGQRAEIDANTSESDLEKRFGLTNVKRDQIYLGEGFFEDGTIIYPDDLTRRIEITWKDDTRRAPKDLRVDGTRGKGTKTVWWIAPGITFGTSLLEIERMNRRPFGILGFAFDGSGSTYGWNGGQLTVLSNSVPNAGFRLDPGDDVIKAKLRDYNAVQGDRHFSSGHPSMQALNPRVCYIYVSFQPRQ